MAELLVDKRALLENLDNDPAFLKEIIGIFLTECPTQVAAIRTAIDTDNCSDVMKAAHSLRGSVGVFGAKTAVDAAQNLESMGREEKKEGFGEAFAFLEQEMALVSSALREILKEGP
jgi:HPt (histidine-containing phosphotransfer) domain-containing protein